MAGKVTGGNCGDATGWGSGLNVTQSKNVRRGRAGAIGGGEAYIDWGEGAGEFAILTGAGA